MTLLDHLNSTSEGVLAFADRIGVARTTIRKIAYGQRQPSLDLAARIAAATNGKVLPRDMMRPVPPVSASNAVDQQAAA